MLTVSNSIKQAYNQYTTQRKSYIQVGNNSFFIQNLDVSADAYYEGNVIGNAIAKIAKFDIETVNVNGIDEFELFDGIWTGNQYEYVSLGTFKLFNEEGTDDFFSSITAYDKLINFNKEYDPSLTTYPTTLYGLLQNICSQAGVELENTSIPNGNQPLPSNLFVENETLKMILNAICQISGNFGIISKDKLKLLLKGTETVNLSKYQLSNPEYKRTTWKINQVVLGMKDVEGEYVLRQDDKDIEQNGVHKLVINDNPFVYRQDLRETYIDNLFNQVKGFGYTAFETTWEGLSYVELGDLINIDGKESIILRYNLKSPQGLNSTLSAPSIIDSVVDYVDNSNSIANRQRRTELWVDKQLGQIKGEVTKVETTVENITTTTQTSTGGNNLYIADALESNVLEYHIEGKSEQETSVASANILDLEKLSQYFLSDNTTYSIINSNSIKVSTDSSSGVYHNVALKLELEDGNYIGYVGNVESSNSAMTTKKITISKYVSGSRTVLKHIDAGSTNGNFTITNDENTTYALEFWGSYETAVENTVTYDECYIKKGTSFSNYEPFIPNSPSPEYPSEIKTIPSIRNLFDSNLFEQFTAGLKFINLQLKPNTTYTMSSNYSKNKAGTYGNLFFYNTSGSSATGTSDVSLGISRTITTGSDGIGRIAYRDVDSEYSNESTDYWYMIVEGTIAHDYVPYGAWAKVKITGKNLFDKDNTNILNGYVNATGNVYTENSNFKTLYLKINSNTTYTVSKIASARFNISTYTDIPVNGDVATNLISYNAGTKLTITSGSSDKYLCVFYFNQNADTLTEQEILNSIMVEENDTVTEYEAYKEKEVLIDLSKPNLYDGVSESGNISTSDGSNTTADNAWRSTNYLPIDNLTNTLEINDINYTGTVGRMYFYDESKTYISNVLIDKLPYVFTAPTDTKYIRFFVLNSVATLDTNVKIYEGYTDHYELSSIEDTKDTLDIVNGQVVIDEKIDKVVLDGSTEIIIYTTASSGNGFYVKVDNIYYGGTSSVKRGTLLSNKFSEKSRNEIYLGNEGITYNSDSNYVIIYTSECSGMTIDEFKTWLSENPVTVYYELKEPQQIVLPNTQIPLFDGINHITLVDDIETKTSIKYLRNTPISSEYATNQQLGETNSNLANTTDKTNQNASDISATNTNLNNNYYNKEQIDAVQTTTEQVITEIRNTVETSVTATQANIDVINQTLQNGVEKVSTSTGYTFDSEGLHIKKSDEDLESLVDNTGIYVNNNDENMLTANSDGVKATNLEAKNFFILHPFRLEETVAMTDNSVKGIGFFYIGDE